MAGVTDGEVEGDVEGEVERLSGPSKESESVQVALGDVDGEAEPDTETDIDSLVDTVTLPLIVADSDTLGLGTGEGPPGRLLEERVGDGVMATCTTLRVGVMEGVADAASVPV